MRGRVGQRWQAELLLRFADVRGLRAFLSLHDFKIYSVAFLQAFVALRGDGAVVNEHIRPIVSSNEAISFSVVKPLNRTFQAFTYSPRPGVPAGTQSQFSAIVRPALGTVKKGSSLGP